MPPWETVKSLLSFLVTDGVPDPEEQLRIGMFDILRAHFLPKAHRIFYRAFGRSQGARGWLCGWAAELCVWIQRCEQQLDARLAESSPVRRVCSWQLQSCVVLQHSEIHGDDFFVLANSRRNRSHWHGVGIQVQGS